MTQSIVPPLTDAEKRLIQTMVEAIIHRNRPVIRKFKKSDVYNEEVFFENMQYCGVGPDDMPDDLFTDVHQYYDKDADFSLLRVLLRDHGTKKNRVQVFIQRGIDGGDLQLNSIGDIEPEDQM